MKLIPLTICFYCFFLNTYHFSYPFHIYMNLFATCSLIIFFKFKKNDTDNQKTFCLFIFKLSIYLAVLGLSCNPWDLVP